MEKQLKEVEKSLVLIMHDETGLATAEKHIKDFIQQYPDEAKEIFALIKDYLDNELLSVAQFTHLVQYTRQCMSSREHLQTDEDNDEDRTIIASDDDKTIIGGKDESHKTVIRSPSKEKPKEQPPENNTPTSHTTPTSPSSATSNSWNKPFEQDDAETKIGIGSIIKDRFRLTEFVGRGGMGDVYKAEDLRRIDADDVESEVAIKLLNKEFRDHPDSLRALQREARKTQSLAHPHIVNVYDFDRDNSHVFMTMEYMDGEPLNEVIRKHKLGMEPTLVLKLVQELCSALQYAHRRGIIHSDLKPSNIFLTRNQEIKVFDFGIARAANVKNEDTNKVDTFDAGSIGALTPAYASPEMIEGDHSPSGKDDIYALGCIVCEMYTGCHPFLHNGKKQPANEAEKLSLVPPKIKALSKRQQAALEKTLAFKKEERTRNIEEFINTFIRNKSQLTPKKVLAGAVGTAIALIAVTTTVNYYDKKDVNALLESIANKEDALIRNTVQSLLVGDKAVRDKILKQREVSEELKKYYRSLALQQAKKDEYENAIDTLTIAQKIYPDSKEIDDLLNKTDESRKERIKQIFGQLDAILQDEQKVYLEHQQIGELLQTLYKVDSNNKRLSNPQPLYELQEAIEDAIASDNLQQAEAMIYTANSIMNEFAGFSEFKTSIAALEQKITDITTEEERVARVSSLLSDLNFDKKASLSSFLSKEDNILELRQIAPADEDVIALMNKIENLFSSQLSTLIEARKWQQATDMANSFSGILGETTFSLAREAIEQSKSKFNNELTRQIESILDYASNEQAEKAVSIFESLELSYVDPSKVTQIREVIAKSWLTSAQKNTLNNQWDNAYAAIQKGIAIGPSEQLSEQLKNEKNNVTEAKAAFQVRSQEQERILAAETKQKRIDQLADDIQSKLDEAEFTVAEITALYSNLEALKKDQPDHPLVSKTDSRIKERIRHQIQRNLKLGNYSDTRNFASGLFAEFPRFRFLKEEIADIDNLISEEEKRKLRIQLDTQKAELLSNIARAETEQDFLILEKTLSEFAQQETNKANVADVEEGVRFRLKDVAEGYVNDLRFDQAKLLLNLGDRFGMKTSELAFLTKEIESKEAFRKRQQQEQQKQSKIESLHETLLAYLETNDIDKADEALDSLKKINGLQASQPERIDDAYFQSYIRLSDEAYRQLDLTTAENWLAKAAAKNAGASVLSTLRAKYRAVKTILSAKDKNLELAIKLKQSASRTYPEDTVIKGIKLSANTSGSSSTGSQSREAGVSPMASSVACTSGMAGKGAIYTCRDALTSTFNGPYLVVLPPFENKNLAITKYEIRIGEFNVFCRETKKCREVAGNDVDPVTGVSVGQILQFTQWLSKSTASTYRLPTVAEWRFAAKADDSNPPELVNCSVNGKPATIQQVNFEKSRTSNNWGLSNFLGNVQEIASVRKGYAALGGNIEDDVSRCNVNFSRFLTKDIDHLTGFRLIKELD